jgi:hypothetical protein
MYNTNYLLEYYSNVMLKNYKGGFMYNEFYPVNNEQETINENILSVGNNYCCCNDWYY